MGFMDKLKDLDKSIPNFGDLDFGGKKDEPELPVFGKDIGVISGGEPIHDRISRCERRINAMREELDDLRADLKHIRADEQRQRDDKK